MCVYEIVDFRNSAEFLCRRGDLERQLPGNQSRYFCCRTPVRKGPYRVELGIGWQLGRVIAEVGEKLTRGF